VFQRRKKLQTEFNVPLRPIKYPSGICVKVSEDYYYVKGSSLYRLISQRAAESWAVPVAEGREINISEYKIAASMGFRDGTLIQNISDGKLYLISGSKRRLVTDPDVLDWYGLNLGNIVLVSDKEASAHADGEDI
jgi:hypothetical protein